MKDFIGTGGETPEEILHLLKANADDTEQMKYVRYFSDSELAEKTEDYIQKSVTFEKLSDEKEKLVKQLTAQMKPLKIETKSLLTEIKNKGEKRDEDVFVFIDQDEREVGYYSFEGKLIHSRKALRTEIRQPGLFNLKKETEKSITIMPDQAAKTGTDDFSFPGETEGTF